LLEDGDWLMLKAAIEVLDVDAAAAVADVLVEALKDPLPILRWAATLALAQVGNHVPVENLVAGLHEQDVQRRAQAADALRRWNGPVALDPLIAAVLHVTEDSRSEYKRNEEALIQRTYLNLTLRDHAVAYPPLRRTAVLWLGLQGEQAPLDLLLAAASDPNKYVRVEAIEALARVGERAPAAVLRKALHDDFDWVRNVAADALRARGERLPVAEVRALLREPEGDRRKLGVKVLDLCEGKIASAALVAVLRQYRGANFRGAREEAARALGRLGEGMPVEAIVNELRRQWPRPTFLSTEAMAMIKALAHAGKRFPADALTSLLVSDADDPFRSLRPALAQALAAHADQLSPDLLLLGVDSERADVRAHTVTLLGMLGDRAPVEQIFAMRRDVDWQVRVAALKGLKNLGERGIGLLVVALGSAEVDIRKNAASFLGQFGPLAPIEPLVAATSDTDSSVRLAALEALSQQAGRVDPNVAREVVLPACGDEDVQVAQAAMTTLVDLGFGDWPEVREALSRATRAERADLRLAAARALAKLGDRTSVALFAELARHPDAGRRWVVVSALARLGRWAWPESVGPLRDALEDRDKSVRLEAVEGLTPLAAGGVDAAVSALAIALQDANFQVSVAALAALAACGERAPVDALSALLGASSLRVRFDAAITLHKTHPAAFAAVAPQAEALLRSGAPGPALAPIVQSFVAETLGEMAVAREVLPEDMSERLVALLDQPDWDVQMYAAQTLGKLQQRLPELAREKLRTLQHSDIRRVREAAALALMVGDGISL
jgi:HEAT repeat protein